LEAARLEGVEHLVYASSSSVYGRCLETPFLEIQRTDEPVSLYAATKKANEAMAFAYSSIHAMRCTGLRFFTVYGPWGRPDMAYFSFAERLRAGAALPVFADGMLQRDFTYIDDIVEGVVRLTLSARRSEDPPHEIFNIGNHHPVRVIDFIEALSGLLGVTPKLEFLPMQPGDVPITCANVDKLRARVGFEPATPLGDGLAQFVQWFDAWRKRSDGRTGV
jgi:UDP-glucuronate 4-epimerase